MLKMNAEQQGDPSFFRAKNDEPTLAQAVRNQLGQQHPNRHWTAGLSPIVSSLLLKASRSHVHFKPHTHGVVRARGLRLLILISESYAR